MKAIQIISQDLFDKIRSRFQNLEMGDETGAVTIDPSEARFFDFDFVLEGKNLGRVSISLNDLGSLKIYYSQGITEGQDDTSKHLWYSFLKEMRFFAMRRLLRFDTRDIAKTNLDRNDFQYLATKQASKEQNMNTPVNESRWNSKNTKKTSRAIKGTTEVIVRHSRPVDEMYPGARSQKKNIKAIFIQNKDGERFKYPFIHPAGAFAMAQHVDHGGIPHDPAGKAIMRMSEQIAQLQEFQRKVHTASLHPDATGITERAIGRLHELKSCIEALGKRHHYESWMAEFQETEDPVLGELDNVTMEEYKSKFTETNFKEEIAQFFPLLHSIMSETNKLNLEDYVNEGDECEVCHESPCVCDEKVKESVDDFAQFEEWAEAVEQGKLTDDQIASLKSALENLSTPLDLDTAYNFFNEFGIDDSDLATKFQQAKELDSTTDPLSVFKLWAKESYPELLVALGMSGTAAPQEPTEPAPPAEENTDMQMHPGTMENSDPNAMIKEVAKIVKQFYNEDNPNVGPFRGEEGILIDVEKTISEKFGDQAGAQARQVAEAYMQKLTQEWQQKHGEVANGHGDDGLARIKELIQNVKQRVEGIGDQGMGGRDFNKNIMPAENKDDVDEASFWGNDKMAKAAQDASDSTSTVRGKDEKGTYTAKLVRKKGEQDHKEVSREYDTKEGAEFGSQYSEKLAQQVFDANPNIASGLPGENEVLNQAYAIVKAERGPKSARYMFNYDEDFPSDVVTSYFWLQRNQGQAEGADMDQIPAYVRKQKQQSQDTAQQATDKRNEKTGAQVWSSKRANEEFERILKLSGLAK